MIELQAQEIVDNEYYDTAKVVDCLPMNTT